MEQRLQSRPTKVTPNVNSLWLEVMSDREKPGYTQPKVLSNIAVAAQRSLLAINYVEFFATVQRKAIHLLMDNTSETEERTAALDIVTRISPSMGRCLEDIAQAFILTSSTAVRREAVLQQHELPDDVSNWLRAQPILAGEALFGSVTDIAKPLLELDLARRTLFRFMSVPFSHKEHPVVHSQQNPNRSDWIPEQTRLPVLNRKPCPRVLIERHPVHQKDPGVRTVTKTSVPLAPVQDHHFRLGLPRISPVGARLREFYDHWEAVTEDSWTLSVIRSGFKLEFVQNPPLALRPVFSRIPVLSSNPRHMAIRKKFKHF
jgi:hypothetical protein